MASDVGWLDDAGEAEARELLASCCGSSRWVDLMIAGRPYDSREKLARAADDAWAATSREDWLEAFDHHPRIGERAARAAQGSAASAWSAAEQGAVTEAAVDVKDDLSRVNADYERRFGFIYIVCAAGKSAAELLRIARERLRNDPDVELRVAAEEQRRIMQLRLARLPDSAGQR